MIWYLLHRLGNSTYSAIYFFLPVRPNIAFPDVPYLILRVVNYSVTRAYSTYGWIAGSRIIGSLLYNGTRDGGDIRWRQSDCLSLYRLMVSFIERMLSSSRVLHFVCYLSYHCFVALEKHISTAGIWDAFLLFITQLSFSYVSGIAISL